MINLKWCLVLAAMSGAQLAVADDEVVGEAKHCVLLTSVRSTEVVDDQTILFHMNGRKTLVNNLPRKCPGLRSHRAFSYKTSIGKLCNTDIIRVYEGDYFGAACGLGMFEPYDETKSVKDS